MSKLLAQGGFGCLYYPGIKCSGASSKSLKRATKLQRNDKSSNNEFYISSIIKTIPNYKYFFSPILDSCPVSIAKVKKSLLDKCDVYKKNKDDNDIQYILMSLEYIKNISFQNIVSKSSSRDIIKIILENFEHLLRAISLLLEKNIVHYDLKLENILFEKETKTPIIIDFGISIKIDEINMENLSEYFYVFSPDYYLWPFEVHALCYYVHNDMKPLTKDDVEMISEQFVEQNYGLYFFDDDSVSRYKNKCVKFLEKYIGIEAKIVVKELIKSYKTWDLYSLSILYLSIMQILFENGFNDNKILNSFYNLLWTNIQPDYKKRLSVDDTINKFTDLLYNKYEDVYSQLIETVSFTSENVNNKIKYTTKKLNDIVPK